MHMPQKKPQTTNYKLKTKIKPELPGGFRDYGPEDAIARQKMIEKIRKTFEDFGFDPLETPAVERTEVLTDGEKDSGKIIFNLSSSAKELKSKDKSKISLRFDLTVPLARFLAGNPEIPKPFKRYQIGNVWRGESPQAGRYREFMQADIDIVGTSSMEADSEIVILIYRVFKNLGINNFLININNRKILNGLPKFAGFPEKKLSDALRIIDKRDKIGEKEVAKELARAVGKKQTERIMQFLFLSGDAKQKLLGARELLKDTPSAEEGIKELAEIVRNIRAAGVEERNWQINFCTVRGLGYYTGPVFETVLTEAEELGSVFSGGRYDGLAEKFGQKISAVGVSAGIDRLFVALDKLGATGHKKTTTRALILNLSPELKTDYFAFDSELRKAGISSSIYLGDDRAFQAQLAYAVKKEIPFVIIYGDRDKEKNVVTVKNLVTREQKEIPKDKLVEYIKNPK